MWYIDRYIQTVCPNSRPAVTQRYLLPFYLDIKDKTPTPLSTDSDMGDTDVTECRRCGDDNELWPCFGCSDWYCVDCLGGEMQVIDQVPPDPEKWFCTPSCKAIYHWRLLYAHAFTIGKLYLYVKRSKERSYWVKLLSCLLSLVLLVSLISIQFGIIFTKNALLFSFHSYLY